MKKILLFVLAASLTVAAQGKGGGGARGGPPAGAGPGVSTGSGMSRTDTAGRPDTTGRPDATGKQSNHPRTREQQPLKDSQTKGGSFKMLEEKTGKTSAELKAMYAASGAKNYGQFVSAVVVSKNLGLDTQAVLDGLKTKSLGQTLQDMGIAKDQAKAEIKKAEAQVKASKRRN
ncbi:MAG: hypothetical protein ABIP81_07310 [Terriglobales bacterium]